MGSERALWNTVRNNMKDHWEAERVENPVNPGMPDVYYTLKHNGSMGWLELKYAHQWPKRKSTPLQLDHFTPQQRSFMKRHGELGANVHMLLQVGRQYFLLDWGLALDIGTMTKEEFEYWAKGKWENGINYDEFWQLLL